jgi:hypothetical protein
MPKRITLGILNYTSFLHPRVDGFWNHGSESRNNYASGHEYSKGGFQVSAAMGIFDGKRKIIEKLNQTYDRISSRIAASLHSLPHV